jgi:hypothetical protein
MSCSLDLSTSPDAAGLLGIILDLVQSAREKVLNLDTQHEGCERAHTAEVDKLKQISDMDGSMKLEIEILHKDRDIHEELDQKLKYLQQELAASNAQSLKLKDINAQIKEKNNDLLNMVLDQDEIISTLEKQVEDLLALLDRCPEAKQLLEQSTESPTSEEEKGSLSAADSNTSGTQLLKRKPSAADGGSEGSRKKTRRK